MWLQTTFTILPFLALIFFLLSIYGHKMKIKELNKKVEVLRDQKVYGSYIFTKMDNKNDYTK
ncbi:hypothetical protein ASS77_12320 [Staphylococcus saprophyticus]|uniref:hypothetical protein n=1 Tax=Staphylococcus saprophyticus TaxID=29385 RepID=UPI00085A2743|nr:hypothetical protein [Staphylococcus saprophyticus]MBN6849478.1 hypothetical protein [Staphylococcus saprophyticus]OEK13221.1 hypothetical protein ASS77_12320 [Staphylococcus saprophyticus]